MADPTIDELVGAFVEWTRGRDYVHPKAVRIVRRALYAEPERVDGGWVCWRRGDLKALLLETFPSASGIAPALVSLAVPALRAFVRFLDGSGRLAAGSDPATELLDELHQVANDYFVAMLLAERRNPVEELPIDFPDLDQAALARFRPPITLVPTRAELADHVRELPLVTKAFGFARLIEDGLELTVQGTLYQDHAERLAADLEVLLLPTESDELALVNVLNAAECAELIELQRGYEPDHDEDDEEAEVALESDYEPDHYFPTELAERWPDLGDAAVLAVWLRMYAGALRPPGREILPGPMSDEGVALFRELAELVSTVSVAELFRLYRGDSVDLRWCADDLADRVSGTLLEGRVQEDVRWLLGTLLEVPFRLLVHAGVLQRYGDSLTLTPLGRWGVARHLRALDRDPRTVERVAEASATELLELRTRAEPERARGWLAEWIAARSAKAAGVELTHAAGSADRRQRTAAFEALELVGEPAAPAVRELLDEPALRPYAIDWLRRLGAEPDQRLVTTPDDERLRFVDAVAAALESGDPHEPADLAAVDVRFVEELWRCAHPDTHAVLEFLGASHPSKPVAKAARRAAFKLRSRPAA